MAQDWRRLAAGVSDQSDTVGRAALYRLGPERYRDRVVFAWLRSGADADAVAWQRLAALPQRWQVPRFPLRAADLMARGVPKGPSLGRTLAEAEEAWIADGFPHEPAALERIVEDAVQGCRE
jgi:poly(A) polymerase